MKVLATSGAGSNEKPERCSDTSAARDRVGVSFMAVASFPPSPFFPPSVHVAGIKKKAWGKEVRGVRWNEGFRERV